MQGLEITPETMPQLALFGAVAGIVALASVGVVGFGSAVRSALCLVVTFFMLAVLYFTLGAQTLGIIQIVVYTGAIMVLFLFVIMLLNLGGINLLTEKRDPKLVLGSVLGLGLFALIATQILLPIQQVNMPRAAADYGKPENLGVTLFSVYVWPFELASFLLLIGIVGSILLAKRRILPSAPVVVQENKDGVAE